MERVVCGSRALVASSQSSIEIIQNAPLGGLVAIMSGPRNQVEAAVRFLIEKNVQVEVIKDGRVASSVCS